MNLWIVGRDKGYAQWELTGVFSTQKKAEDACTTVDDFVAPLILDSRAPEETIPWPDAYYPLTGGASGPRCGFRFECEDCKESPDGEHEVSALHRADEEAVGS